MVSGNAVATASARDRLLAAADELFYEEGIHTVGIDRIIEKAGVAKATLYSVFGSKEELIRAYLAARLAAASVASTMRWPASTIPGSASWRSSTSSAPTSPRTTSTDVRS